MVLNFSLLVEMVTKPTVQNGKIAALCLGQSLFVSNSPQGQTAQSFVKNLKTTSTRGLGNLGKDTVYMQTMACTYLPTPRSMHWNVTG